MNKDIKELYVEYADILKALAHPVRLCIVKGLLEQGERNVTCMQNCLDLPQSTVSQHLQKLRSAGIIKGNRDGLEVNYYICNDKVKEIISVLFEM
ncbi:MULTISPECIES: metalloregulator ArsR/SmtB family transcription factor [Clostridium]|uniref:Winged helix-turn-helix transcriptional regulator n=1 Tax=Clostridium senegalense TaxID=1465809 RepID=A0A6M0H808_9CLOT|nr:MULTISPECIES: metalloregulator ArsR/SmtB family transcription factor [Clostridium]NEU05692.1 winged helix-turn-helix transcriptional regulator [Clostridium senegalense]